MRVTVLGSGSAGNATLVQAGGTRVLIDCGLGPNVIEERMRRVFGSAVSIHAIVGTHPHDDHVGELGSCAKRFDAPVFINQPTRRRSTLRGARVRVFGRNARFSVGAIDVDPMPVPHDAPNQALVLEQRGVRLGIVTDLGHIPRGLAAHFAGCHALLFESNHDPAMLERGPYPDFLKRRIASERGHLSNAQAAGLFAKLGPETRDVVLMHLSQQCNSPLLALAAARTVLRRGVKLHVAHQDEPLDLRVRVTQPASRPEHGQLALF